MKIKSITIITAEGTSSYRSGFFGVTEITETAEQIGEHEWVYFYVVMKGEDMFAKISKTCPVEITYFKPDKS